MLCTHFSESHFLRSWFYNKNLFLSIHFKLSLFQTGLKFLKSKHTNGFGECWMPNNQKGLCLPLKDCPNLNALANKRHLRIADRLYLKRSRCGYVGLMPLVCCVQPDNIKTRFNGSPLGIDDLPSDCGRIQSTQNLLMDYIVGGKEARIYDSPWLTLLQYKKRTFFFF